MGEDASTIIKTILCPVDFSRPSEEALRFAGGWSRRTGAKAVVLNLDHFEASDRVREEKEALSYLEDFSKRHLGRNVETAYSVEEGNSVMGILGAAKRHNADAIVIGTHGRMGMEAVRMGSVTESVAASSPIPLLVVHDQSRETEASSLAKGRLAFKRVLLSEGVDDSEAVENLLDTLMIGRGGSRRRVATLGWGEDKNAKALLDDAKRAGPDLIVISGQVRENYGQTAPDRATCEVLRSAPCPVLVLPSSQDAS